MHGGGWPCAPTIRNGSEIFREAKKGPNSGNWACTSFYLVVRTTCSRVLISREIKKDRTMRLTLFFPPSIPPPLYIYTHTYVHTHTVILLRPFYRAAAELLLHYRSPGENKTSSCKPRLPFESNRTLASIDLSLLDPIDST